MLCALDYGLTDGVNDAIEALVARQIPGSVACLAVSDLWPRSANRLEELQKAGTGQVRLGLSLRLTGAFTPVSTGFSPDNAETDGYLPRLVDLEHAANRFALQSAVIEAEMRAQMRRFMSHARRTPDFILLDQPTIQFAAAAEAATRMLRHFELGTLPVICPFPPRVRGLRRRITSKLIWNPDLALKQPWLRRHILEVSEADRLPPRSSWHQDGKIWSAIRPSASLDRLARFDEEPEKRRQVFDWFG